MERGSTRLEKGQECAGDLVQSRFEFCSACYSVNVEMVCLLLSFVNGNDQIFESDNAPVLRDKLRLSMGPNSYLLVMHCVLTR